MYDARIHVIMSTNKKFDIFLVYMYIYNIDWNPQVTSVFVEGRPLKNLEKKNDIFSDTLVLIVRCQNLQISYLLNHRRVMTCVTWYVANITRFKKHKMVMWTATPFRYAHFISGGFLSTKPSAATVAYLCSCQGIWKPPTKTIYPKNHGWDPMTLFVTGCFRISKLPVLRSYDLVSPKFQQDP